MITWTGRGATIQFPVSRHFLQQQADLVVAVGELGQAGSQSLAGVSGGAGLDC